MNPTIRVLYAEDNPQDADLTRSRFAENAPDFEIEIVGTGQECLERLHREAFDLLLLDHHLPDMEGLDILKCVVHVGIRIPVVLVTAVGDEDLVVKVLRLGAVNYASKNGNYLETLPDLLRDEIHEYHHKLDQGLLTVDQKRILYVEHLSMDVDLTLQHFSEAAPHLVVDVARSCNEALARLTGTHEYDLTLIDMRMPDQSGLDFVREAKRRHFKLPPFIIVTGRGDDAAAIATLKMGAADYIVKRDGYLNQLTYCIDHAIAHNELNHLNEKLRIELLERHRAEEALRESEKRWRIIFEQAPDSILIIDPQNGTLLDYNDKACESLGYSREEFSGMTLAEIKFTESPEEVKTYLANVTRHGFGTVETKHRTKTDEPRDVLVDSKTLLLHGKICLLETWRDITDRNRAAMERQKLEEQLRQSQKMESVGRLAGGVAHDFNNMLQAIMGFSYLALDEVKPEERLYRYLTEIQDAAQRSADLTRQLLAFARKQTVSPKVLDLNDTVSSMLKMLQRLIGEDIDLIWKPGYNLGQVKIDPSQLDQILANLTVNARDAISGVGKITIETDNQVIDEVFCSYHAGFTVGEFVKLSVSDDGCGMNSETIGQIFEPFFTTKGIGEGTGLGLATIYGIVKQNDGAISVYSEVGQGTTFHIYLPRFIAQGDEAGASLGDLAAPSTGNETILIVEDEEAILTIGKAILSKLGYTVLTANTTQEAIRIASEYQGDIHLLLTDVVMPEMNGRELSEQIVHLRPDVKMLFMSGYTAHVIAHRGVLEEGVMFLQKPFSGASLAAKVREALGT